MFRAALTHSQRKHTFSCAALSSKGLFSDPAKLIIKTKQKKKDKKGVFK